MMNDHDGHALVVCLPTKLRQMYGLYTSFLLLIPVHTCVRTYTMCVHIHN